MGNNRNRNRNKKKPAEDNYIPPFPANQLVAPIDGLGLREDTLDLLIGAGLHTVVDLVKRTDSDFYRIMRFNKKNLLDVKSRLNAQKMFLKPQPEPVPAAGNDAPRTNGSEQRDPVRRGNQIPAGGEFSKRKDPSGETRDFSRNSYGSGNSRQNSANGRGGNAPRPQRDARGKNGMRADDVSERKTKELKEKNRPLKTLPETIQDIYVKVNKGGKWGFSDRKGKIVVAPVYDEIYSYKEDLCCVELNEKAGYIDRNGEVVIDFQYDCASSFSEGFACVFKGEKCGYINKENEVVVDFLYDAGTAFENGSCRVKKDGKWGELNFVTREDGSLAATVRWIV